MRRVPTGVVTVVPRARTTADRYLTDARAAPTSVSRRVLLRETRSATRRQPTEYADLASSIEESLSGPIRQTRELTFGRLGSLDTGTRLGCMRGHSYCGGWMSRSERRKPGNRLMSLRDLAGDRGSKHRSTCVYATLLRFSLRCLPHYKREEMVVPQSTVLRKVIEAPQ